MARSIRKVSAVLFVSLAGLLTVPACGSSHRKADDAAKVKLAPAPDLGIALHVEGDHFASKVKDDLVTAMTAAGYKVVTNDKGADVTGNIKVTSAEQASMMVVQVNGRQKKSYNVTVAASFVGADGAVVEAVSTDFESDDGTVPPGTMRPLLVQLSESGKLVAYQKSAKERNAAAEDDLWKAANADGCKAATKKEQCDGVRAYIAKYSAGKYTADGRSALQAADDSLAKNAEENTWKAAALEICLKPTKSYDCQGVDEYIKKYPGGAHATEGRDAMKKTEKQREGLKRKEDAAKKAASAAECEKECRRSYERAVYFELLVNRCVQTECH